MAESQVPYPYTPEQLQAIRGSISEPRFATYLRKGGNHPEYALMLYLYNARVAKAFLYPLSVAEVTLRNAVDQILVATFQANWHQEPGFRDQTLSPEGLATLDKAILRAGQNAPRDQVVATLTFDFWSNLFRPDYAALWRTNANRAFPHLRHREGRHEIQTLVKAINTFRNRVAHHEPVLDLNINDIYAKIIQLIELRCAETAAWMKHHSTVGSIVRTRPRRDGTMANSLATKMDRGFISASPGTTLFELIDKTDEKHQAIVCVKDDGSPVAAFTAVDVTRYISACSRELEGMVSLADHKVADLLAGDDFTGRWMPMVDSTPIGMAVKELQKPRIQLLVGVDGQSGKVTGTIIRAHRRY